MTLNERTMGLFDFLSLPTYAKRIHSVASVLIWSRKRQPLNYLFFSLSKKDRPDETTVFTVEVHSPLILHQQVAFRRSDFQIGQPSDRFQLIVENGQLTEDRMHIAISVFADHSSVVGVDHPIAVQLLHRSVVHLCIAHTVVGTEKYVHILVLCYN